MNKLSYQANELGIFVNDKCSSHAIKIESLYLIGERFDFYMKLGIKIESLYWIGFVVSSKTRGSFINLY